MKSQEELFNIQEELKKTIIFVTHDMNSLSNEEIKQAAEMFEYDEHERDPLTLLSAPKLFEYMKYANGAVDIDFGE